MSKQQIYLLIIRYQQTCVRSVHSLKPITSFTFLIVILYLCVTSTSLSLLACSSSPSLLLPVSVNDLGSTLLHFGAQHWHLEQRRLRCDLSMLWILILLLSAVLQWPWHTIIRDEMSLLPDDVKVDIYNSPFLSLSFTTGLRCMMCVHVRDDAEFICCCTAMVAFCWNILQETSPQLKMEGGFPWICW